jgi:hypothetical protein
MGAVSAFALAISLATSAPPNGQTPRILSS